LSHAWTLEVCRFVIAITSIARREDEASPSCGCLREELDDEGDMVSKRARCEPSGKI
jgi:hypothetical protein